MDEQQAFWREPSCFRTRAKSSTLGATARGAALCCRGRLGQPRTRCRIELIQQPSPCGPLGRGPPLRDSTSKRLPADTGATLNDTPLAAIGASRAAESTPPTRSLGPTSVAAITGRMPAGDSAPLPIAV